jgi:hypothetical protein
MLSFHVGIAYFSRRALRLSFFASLREIPGLYDRNNRYRLFDLKALLSIHYYLFTIQYYLHTCLY